MNGHDTEHSDSGGIPQQCGLCGAFLPKPKPGERWMVCGRCGAEYEVAGCRS